MSRANEPVHSVKTIERYWGGPMDGQTNEGETGGLTIREHFAGLAMQGLCAHFGTMNAHDLQSTAGRSAEMADALIAELAKAKP